MNIKFLNHLARLESVATPADRALINNIRGQYAKMEASFLSRDVPVASVKSATSAGTMQHNDASKGGPIETNTKKFAQEKATLERTVKNNMSKVTKYAHYEPARVDAWVDKVLEPAIERGKNQNKALDFNGGQDAAYAEKKAQFDKEMEDMAATSQKMSNVAKGKKEMSKEQADAFMKDFAGVDTKKSEDGDKKSWWKRLFASDMRAARAAFESVYGDSSRFSDDEIATICESIYRRTHA